MLLCPICGKEAYRLVSGARMVIEGVGFVGREYSHDGEDFCFESFPPAPIKVIRCVDRPPVVQEAQEGGLPHTPLLPV